MESCALLGDVEVGVEAAAGALADEHVEVHRLAGFERDPISMGGVVALSGFGRRPHAGWREAVVLACHENEAAVYAHGHDVVGQTGEAVEAVLGRGDLAFIVHGPHAGLDDVVHAEGLGGFVGAHRLDGDLGGVNRAGDAEVAVEHGFVPIGLVELGEHVAVGGRSLLGAFALLGLFEIVEDADEGGLAGFGAGAEGGVVLRGGEGRGGGEEQRGGKNTGAGRAEEGTRARGHWASARFSR